MEAFLQDWSLAMPMTSGMNCLSRNDALHLLALINVCHLGGHETDMVDILTVMHHLLSPDLTVCGIAKTGRNGKPCAHEATPLPSFPEWVESYAAQYKRIPFATHEREPNLRVQYWSTASSDDCPAIFTHLAKKYDLRNGYVISLADFPEDNESPFVFCGNRDISPRTEVAIKTLEPHLHLAFKVVARRLSLASSALSDREKEIMNWVRHGKTSWEIGAILSISERTVNFHVQSVCRKLHVQKRSQAVAVAIEWGLVD